MKKLIWYLVQGQFIDIYCGLQDCGTMLSSSLLPIFHTHLMPPSYTVVTHVVFTPENGGGMLLQNIGNHQQDHMESQPRRTQLTPLLPWEPKFPTNDITVLYSR
jgi:hypothetical protein